MLKVEAGEIKWFKRTEDGKPFDIVIMDITTPGGLPELLSMGLKK
jgi:hypothetical protein